IINHEQITCYLDYRMANDDYPVGTQHSFDPNGMFEFVNRGYAAVTRIGFSQYITADCIIMIRQNGLSYRVIIKHNRRNANDYISSFEERYRETIPDVLTKDRQKS
ncbi:hypothetical protein BZG21_32300, partial [Escherichia coli]|nr:hypothetical protein [Escherichia coli]